MLSPATRAWPEISFSVASHVAVLIEVEPGVENARGGGIDPDRREQARRRQKDEAHAVVARVAVGIGALEAVLLFADRRAEAEAVDHVVRGAVVGGQGRIPRIGSVAEVADDAGEDIEQHLAAGAVGLQRVAGQIDDARRAVVDLDRVGVVERPRARRGPEDHLIRHRIVDEQNSQSDPRAARRPA